MPKKPTVEPYRFTRKRAESDRPARLKVEIKHPYLKGLPVVLETTDEGWEELFFEGIGDPEALFNLLIVPGYEEVKKRSPRGMHAKTSGQRKLLAEARKYAVALFAYAEYWLNQSQASWPEEFSSLANSFNSQVIAYQDGPQKGTPDPHRIAFEAWKRWFGGRLPKPLSPPADVIDFRANYLSQTPAAMRSAQAILQYHAAKGTVNDMSVMDLLRMLV